MSTTGGREDVLRQVSQFWSMLDDLSENDPATYRKFIEEQMKRGAEFNAPPELHSCLRTQILEPKPGLLYINICSWKRVPAPQDLSSLLLPSCKGVLSQFFSFTASQTPTSLLRQISSQLSETQDENSTVQIICRPAEHKKQNLIQVISSTFQGPQVPEYLLEVKSDSAGVPRSMELTVELPKVRSMSECQLRVSKVSGYALPCTLKMNCFDSTVLHCMAGYRIKYIIGLW
ncbi:hypothetical protein GOODEAATRI_021825 [Goodea atripinnis]|uniref:PIH1 domain containing 2 n=1 Tax=Goodea atripinnis TaxID=208336 RepID=A0ABV0NDK9_9TELE